MMVYLPAYIYFCLSEYKSSSLKLPIAIFLKPLRLLSDFSLCVGGVGGACYEARGHKGYMYISSPPAHCVGNGLCETQHEVAGTEVVVVQVERMGPVQNILSFGPALVPALWFYTGHIHSEWSMYQAPFSPHF